MSRQAEQRIVHFVPLAGVATDDQVAGEVAAALGAGGPGPTPISQRAVEEFGDRSDALKTRWGLVLANLQLGAIDEAEHWLELAVLHQVDDAGGTFAYELSVRAEILLARGELEAGLRLWRRVVDRLSSPESATYHIQPPGLDPWTLEVQAVTVVAHAHHDRLDLVGQLTGELPHKLSAILTSPLGTPLPSVFELPICGALLLALGMADLDRGQRSGDEQATRSGVRMTALAERFRSLGPSSRPCPPRAPVTRPSTPTGRHTPRRSRRMPASVARSCEPQPGRRWLPVLDAHTRARVRGREGAGSRLNAARAQR